MDQAITHPLTQPPRRRRWLLWLLVVLMPLGLYGYGVLREWRAERRVANALAAADADDPGWRIDSLREHYDRQPVSERFAAALNAFPTTPPVYRGWYGDDIAIRPGALPYALSEKPNARMPAQYLQILRERLNDTRIPPLRQALGLFVEQPAGRFPETSQTLRRTLASTDRVWYLMSYISDEFLLAVHEGRYDDALNRIQTYLALCGPFSACPRMLVRLMAMRPLGYASEATQTLLAQGVLSGQHLETLQGILLRSSAQVDQLSLLRLIRAEAHEELHRLRTDTAYRDAYYQQWGRIPATASWFEQTKARLHPWFQRWLGGSFTEYHAEALERLNEAIAARKREPDAPLLVPNWMEAWNQSGHPLASYVKVLAAQAMAKAKLEIACTGIACERYRLTTGRWPTSIEELVPTYLPSIPPDPYSGKRVLYRVLPDGAVIYSVWLNRQDDGGKVLDDGSARDRGIRLYNPERRGLNYETIYGRTEE